MIFPMSSGKTPSTSCLDTILSFFAVTVPSRSRVSVVSPKRKVVLYTLSFCKYKSNSFVALSSVTGKSPSPSTSRVPRCPAFFAPTAFLTILTTVFDDNPLGLLTSMIALCILISLFKVSLKLFDKSIDKALCCFCLANCT